jgi:hypothetical protein
MKKSMFILVTGLLVSILVSFSSNAKAQTNQHAVNGLAIGGYDAVAYFTDQQAKKGDSSIQLEWNGAKWLFSKIENRKLFEASPDKYAPQYGGYCAYGASRGYKAQTDPTAWTIVGQKLYLNYSQKVKTAWLPDTTTRIQAANQYWEQLTNKTIN